MLDHSVSGEPGVLVPNRAGLVNMEELSLKTLLECPLCLEQLDVSAKVLPCQHTFCKPCLQTHETGQSQLLCPECQTPAQASTAEELPTNLLLVRLLEGLQVNAGPERNELTPRYDVPTSRPRPIVEETEGQQQEGHNYEKQRQNEVSFRPSMQTQRGNVSDDSVFIYGNGVSLKPQADEDLEYHGYPDDSRQRVYLPLSGSSLQTTSHMPLCRALCDFNPQEMNLQDGQYCLGFLKGDILTFIRRVDGHWIEARHGAKTGICPLQFLEPNSVAAKLLEGKSRKASDSAEYQHWTSIGGKGKASDALSRTTQLGGSQVLGQTPFINALPLYNHRKQPGTSGNNFYTPKGDSSNVTSFNQKSHLQRSSVPPAARSHSHPSRLNSQRIRRHSDNPHRHLPQSEKRMASEAPPTLTLNPQMSSADSKTSSTQQLSISVCAVLYSYKPRRPEELELRRGEMVGVYGKFKEGWLRGLSLRTGKVGILPSNYITPVLRTSARLLETKAANASSQYNSGSVKKPTAAKNPAVVLALDKVNTDGTIYPTGHVSSVPNGAAQHGISSSGVGKSSFHGGSQGWDTVRRIFNPQRGSNQFNQMPNMNIPPNTRHFAQVQASGYSPALQRKKHSILANCVRPFGWMSDQMASSAGGYYKDGNFTSAQDLSNSQPPPNAPQSILVRPDSLKNIGEKPAKSVRFLTDEDSPPLRPRTSSWSAGQVASSSQSGLSPLEVWAPSLTLGRDGPGIILKEGKAPYFRKGLETTITDLNSNSQKTVLPQPQFSAVSAQFSPTRHCVTKTHLAQTDSELTLVQGELVLLHRPRPDGRFLVTQESSGHTGLFQSNILHVLERLS